MESSKFLLLLHDWCSEQELRPIFEFEEIRIHPDKSLRASYVCLVFVPGYNYTGIGYSDTKYDAQSNASHNFILHLIKEEIVSSDFLTPRSASNDTSNKEMQKSEDSFNSFNTKIESTDQLHYESYKDQNLYTTVHGNWTIDNATLYLDKFLVSTGHRYTTYSSSFNGKYFEVNRSLTIGNLGIINGYGIGLNRKTALKLCDLNLIRQLYRMGAIEAIKNNSKTDAKDIIEPYEINIDPSLMYRVHNILHKYNIEPVIKDNTFINDKTSLSLIPNKILSNYDVLKSETTMNGIQWSPPYPNWNPWLSMFIGDFKDDDLYELNEKLKYNNIINLNEKIPICNKIPVFTKKYEILNVIKNNTLCIIQGSISCGKTTQVCQFILDDYLEKNLGAFCNIICAQPTNVSVYSVADRVAFERKEDLGFSVGYSVKFDNKFPRPYGAILFCTFDMLLSKMENGLRGISHIIIDNVHEFDTNIVFLMAILKDMSYNYPDLRIILMFAATNTNIFSTYFYGCPVIDIGEYNYHVKEYFLEDIIQLLNYQPIQGTTNHINRNHKINYNSFVSEYYPPDIKAKVAMLDEDTVYFDIIEALITHIIIKMKTHGTILIFLSSDSMIYKLHKYLIQTSVCLSSNCIIVPFYSQISYADQRKVFEFSLSRVQKIIISTNIAEMTAIIDDVAFVINSGKSTIESYTVHDNMTHLEEKWISKINMKQRKDLCGYFKPGSCFHLCTKERFNGMNENIIPEISHKTLHQIILYIKLLKLGNIEYFLTKFIVPPSWAYIMEVKMLLIELDCLNQNDDLTPLGKILAKLPFDPRIGRMMIFGNILLLGDSIVTTAAIYSNRKTAQFDNATNSFSSNYCSDHIMELDVFYKWISSYNKSKNFRPLLNSTAIIKEQLKDIFIKNGFPDECFKMWNMHFEQNDVQSNLLLELLPGILTMGFYPNVCYFKNRQKVYLNKRKIGVVENKSMKYLSSKTHIQSPFFIFTEKICTEIVTCQEMTMISPIHLLLFGARKIEYINDPVLDDLVVIDDWISLQMDPMTASAIVALRLAIESIIDLGSKSPENIQILYESHRELIEVLIELCKFNTCRYNLPLISFNCILSDKHKKHNKEASKDNNESPNSKMKNKFTNFNDRSLEKKSSVENNNHKKSTIFHNHIEEDHCRIEKVQCDMNISNDSDSISTQSTNLEISKTTSQNQSIMKFIDTTKEIEKDHLDELLARAIFSSDAPFSIVEDKNWLAFFKALNPNYSFPLKTTLSTTFLEKEYTKSYNEIFSIISKANFYSVQVVGWKKIYDSKTNIIITTSESFLLKSIDCNPYNGGCTAIEIKNVIQNLGKEKCIAIITDNKILMQNVCTLLKRNENFKDLPIAYFSCVTYTLYMLILDFTKTEVYSKVMKYSKNIVENIISIPILEEQFSNTRKIMKMDNSTLVLPVKTNSESYYYCLESLLRNKNVLQQMAVTKNIQDMFNEHTREKILLEEYWSNVQQLITLLNPIIFWITILGVDEPKIEYIAEALFYLKKKVIENIIIIPLEDEINIFLQQKINARLSMALHPIHYAANLLSPFFQGKGLENGCDAEGISYIKRLAQSLLDNNEYNKVIIEINEYLSHKGFWEQEKLWHKFDQMNTLDWWNEFCINTILYKVASAIFSTPASLCSIESSFRTCSHYSYRRRNDLSEINALKLSFLQKNIKTIDLIRATSE